ncbi:MAG: TlyA family RNA methyltransferase [Proteobacteria bacterium]|nr:TlyA family RNA methyltransferase [Pseudomonadota bacterium]
MKQSTKSRIDKLLVERGLVHSRTKAQALIMAGRVLVNGQVVSKAGAEVKLDSEVSLTEKLPFVSRAGVKLAGFLDEFAIDVTGLKVIDVGSSTGGFTDCLLQRGSAHLWAVDVGKGLLDWGLRNDNRVTVLEGQNIRFLEPDMIAERLDLAVIDVSFISLKLVLPQVLKFLTDEAMLVVLVKPQFEAGRADIGKGGIVKDPEVHSRVLGEIREFAASIGLSVLGEAVSSIKGAKGNVEFGLYLKRGAFA